MEVVVEESPNQNSLEPIKVQETGVAKQWTKALSKLGRCPGRATFSVCD